VSGPYAPAPGGLVVRVRVTPNAGADRIEGAETRADGTSVLRLRVRAVPDRGKANAAATALLARALSIPPSAVTLTAGATARLKTLRVAGDPAALAAAIDALAAAGPQGR
jgi:uncharacterized protein YggU (UPF0235/DUF167 family)